MTKKQKVVFAVAAAMLVLGMIMSYVFLMKNQHIDSTPEEKEMPAIPKIRGKGSLQPVSGVSFRRYGHRFTRFLLSDP